MSVAAGIAVILGADVATALLAQILSFDLSWLAPMLMLVGYMLFALCRENAVKTAHIGRVLIGLGLMLFALMWIRTAASPMNESETLELVLASLSSDPLFGILVSALITWVMHSSLAMVLLLVTLVQTDVLPVYLGMMMVLGANLGGAIVPLVATLKDSPEAARVPLANVMMRLSGIIILLPFVPAVEALLHEMGSEDARILVDFHLAFNVLIASFFLFFTEPLARLVIRIFPSKAGGDDPARPRYLNDKELDSPAIALSAAMRETLRIADVTQSMLEDTLTALKDNDPALVAKIRKKDNIVDSLYSALKMYMAKITRGSLDPDDSRQYVQILSFSSNLENVGDTIDKSLMEMAGKKIKDKSHFSKQGWQEIQEIHSFVMETMRLAQSVFVSGDEMLARRLIESKEKIRKQEKQTMENHLARIREGIPETIATSSLHLDIIRDYRRINSYMVSIAYPIMEEAGQLRSGPLKSHKKKES